MKHCRAAVAAVNNVVGVAALLSYRNSRDEALLTYEASTLQRKSSLPLYFLYFFRIFSGNRNCV